MATVSITDQIKVLVELQGIDFQIYDLRRQLAAQPAQAAALQSEHEKAAEAVRGAESQHKALELKRNQKELELGEKENQIKKLQAQLFQVKTNKEYSALQKEIGGFKADQSVLEEEILKLMEEAEGLKRRFLLEKEALQAKEVKLKADIQRIDEETKRIESSIQQLQSGRGELLPRVDPKILSKYERILDRKSGVALVPVKKESCGGCHMVLPPQRINEIHMADRLMTCESCARILYLETAG